MKSSNVNNDGINNINLDFEIDIDDIDIVAATTKTVNSEAPLKY